MTYKTTLTTRVVHERATLSQQLQIHLARKYTAHRVVEHVQREDIYMSKDGTWVSHRSIPGISCNLLYYFHLYPMNRSQALDHMYSVYDDCLNALLCARRRTLCCYHMQAKVVAACWDLCTCRNILFNY
jgi:hypothetical protein